MRHETTIDEPSERARAIVDGLRTSLAPVGWTIEAHPSVGPRVQIRFAHPLTATFTLSSDLSADSSDATIERFLRRPEFALIAQAPKDVPHASLIRAIREHARGARWPIPVTQDLALILRAHDVLTPEESEWLSRAGPCWPDAAEVEAASVEGHS